MLSNIILPTGTVDWVIAGGETDQGSHKARPMNPVWLRVLRDQCELLDIPFHVKQWGEWLGGETYAIRHEGGTRLGGFARHQDGTENGHRGTPDHWWSGDAFGGIISSRVGKVAAGRMLDGVIHDARPKVTA